jgi:hypothetical protein
MNGHGSFIDAYRLNVPGHHHIEAQLIFWRKF